MIFDNEANADRYADFYQQTKGIYWILWVFDSLRFADSQNDGISSHADCD